jgi:HEAT repeat protein
MAKSRQSLEAKLAKIRALQGTAQSPEMIKELRAALRDSSNLLVAEAAEVTGKAHLTGLIPDLVAAFERFFENPEKTDKLCRAKIVIAEALNQLDYGEEEILWRGARHVQWEPVWGGQQDSAAPLRVACAFSLVRLRAHGVMPLLIDLLCDSEKVARAGAAQALAYSETEAAGYLLRLKARIGDDEPEVVAECFNGILKLAPEDGVPFVAEFLESADQDIQESALLALGDSRRREAFEVLKSFLERRNNNGLQDTILMALSLLRLPAATDFLLGLVTGDSQARAWSAVSALALHRYDERLRDRTAEAVRQSGRAALSGHFQARFHERSS